MIGGVKELTGEEFGVYVKRILPGGLASSDGKLHLLIIRVLAVPGLLLLLPAHCLYLKHLISTAVACVTCTRNHY